MVVSEALWNIQEFNLSFLGIGIAVLDSFFFKWHARPVSAKAFLRCLGSSEVHFTVALAMSGPCTTTNGLINDTDTSFAILIIGIIYDSNGSYLAYRTLSYLSSWGRLCKNSFEYIKYFSRKEVYFLWGCCALPFWKICFVLRHPGRKRMDLTMLK